MLRRFDRLLIRVTSLPAAVRYWQDSLGARVVSQDRSLACLQLTDGAEIVLHTDASLPEQALYLEVDDVQAMHARRDELRLDFRTPPTSGTRGYFATVRDPFGTILRIADRTKLRAVEPNQALADDATLRGSTDLFGFDIPDKHKPHRAQLVEYYVRVGRVTDDLPYTAHFETIFDAYLTHYAEPKPDRAEVWRHLLTTRKAGKLPKLGAARSKPPEVGENDRGLLLRLLGGDIGKRDRLPYTPRFDDLVEQFNAGRRQMYSAHQIWRLVATMAK